MAREREELRRQQEQLRYEQEKRNNLKRGREVEHGYVSSWWLCAYKQRIENDRAVVHKLQYALPLYFVHFA